MMHTHTLNDKENKMMKVSRKAGRRTVILLLCAAMLLVTAMLGGCGSTSASGGKKGGELNFFNWTEYMPQSVLDAFEKETGIKVNYTTYSSNEEMLAKIQSGEKGMYDLAIASDYMVDIMKANGTITKLDKSKISNLANINPVYMGMPYDSTNDYSVPYMISNALLCYNKEKVPEGITSIKDLYKPEYKNSLVVLDDQRMLIGLAALSLGYSINETDPAKLAEIKAKLIEMKPNIKIFDSDTPKASMISGETSIGYMWCAEVVLSMQENPNIVPVYPEEGICLMFDNFVIPDGAKNKANAEAFINFCLRPEISKMISDEFPYVNPNKAAFALLSDAFKSNPVSNPPESEIAKGQLLENLGDAASLYDDMWTEFKNQ